MKKINKKRIGILSYDSYPFIGGQGRNLTNLVAEFSKRNEVLVFTPFKSKISSSCQVFQLSSKIGKNLLFSICLNFFLEKLVNRYSLNEIIVQGGPGGLLLTRKPSIKLIYVANHTYYQQSKYIKSQFWKIIFYLPEKIGYQNSTKIYSISESTKKVLIKNYGIKDSKIIVNKPKVDRKIFFRDKKIKKNKNIVFFVGRLEKRKGVDFLLKSFLIICQKDKNLNLYIAGKGRMESWIKKFIYKKKIKKRVKILGFISDRELNGWYNKAACVVVPSVFEGFGLTVVEALACGAWVIGTDTDGIRESIINGKNGYLCKYNDYQDLAQKIILSSK
ncbi:MAG: glycosyltransferase family 4 protein [Candidatus Pacebacteria bacterium]|nr:glycosyltransferase family 4 protein [Candidatus Paceibacterota bacterium]